LKVCRGGENGALRRRTCLKHRTDSAGQLHSPSAHRLSNILECLDTHIVEASIYLAADLPIGVVRHANTAGVSDALEAGSDVHAITEEVAALDHDVADVDPDPKVDVTVG
jgi:hypothetical protein